MQQDRAAERSVERVTVGHVYEVVVAAGLELLIKTMEYTDLLVPRFPVGAPESSVITEDAEELEVKRKQKHQHHTRGIISDEGDKYAQDVNKANVDHYKKHARSIYNDFKICKVVSHILRHRYQIHGDRFSMTGTYRVVVEFSEQMFFILFRDLLSRRSPVLL